MLMSMSMLMAYAAVIIQPTHERDLDQWCWDDSLTLDLHTTNLSMLFCFMAKLHLLSISAKKFILIRFMSNVKQQNADILLQFLFNIS